MKKCTVIYNPNSGKQIKENFIDEFINILKNNDYQVEFIYTEYKYHALKIIKDIKDDTDLVISLGGDGTFNEIVTGNLKREKPLLLAHIPIGTTNDIGTMFGYGKNVITNLKLLLEGSIKGIDICIINDRPFVYVAGFGKFMDVSYATTKKMKKILGYFAYIINGIISFLGKTNMYDITYKVNDEVYKGLYSFGIISNANRIAGINNFYKDVKLDDDNFEVLFCSLSKKKDILKSFINLKTKDITKVPGLYFHKTNHLIVKFHKKPRKNWCIDGEELIDGKLIYEITIKKNVQIMMPNKNIDNLFIKK